MLLVTSHASTSSKPVKDSRAPSLHISPTVRQARLWIKSGTDVGGSRQAQYHADGLRYHDGCSSCKHWRHESDKRQRQQRYGGRLMMMSGMPATVYDRPLLPATFDGRSGHRTRSIGRHFHFSSCRLLCQHQYKSKSTRRQFCSRRKASLYDSVSLETLLHPLPQNR